MASHAPDAHDKAEHEARLWKELDGRTTVMLGLSAPPIERLQPMTAFRDKTSRSLFIHVRADNALARRAGREGGQVWISHANPVRFGWEVAKANATKRAPDVGESAHLDL